MVKTGSTPPAMLAAVIACWIAGPRPAYADSDVLVVGGTAERAQLTAVRGASENTLRKAGWAWPARAPSQKEADSLLKCSDSESPWSCIPATISGIRAKDVQRVFVISVEPRPEPTPMIVLTAKIIIASSPQAFMVRQRFCEQCSIEQLVRASEELTQQLSSEFVAHGSAMVDVTSEPPGADIRLDGKPAGTTHARLVVTAGSHAVAVAKPGFSSEIRTITLAPGQAVDVDVALRTVQAAPPPPPVTKTETRPSHLIPVMTIASGTALVGFGGVALYLGHLGSREDRYRYTRATAVGVTATILGLGAIGAGIYLWRGRDGSGLFGVLDRNSSAVVWTRRF